jgi:osmotically-inducible protein OsmY
MSHTPNPLRRVAVAIVASAAMAGALQGCVPLIVGGAAVVGAGMVATDRRSSGAQLDDQGIELRGAARIRDIANDNMNVTVTSFNRQVLLTGTVGTDADKRRAEEVLQRTDNVRTVVNEVRVAPTISFQVRSNDSLLVGKVKASLLDAKDLFANSFKVVAENGTIFLMGLATRRETERATEVTRGVSGVLRVVRVVEIVSEGELAGQPRQGGTGASSQPSSGSSVPLPPMEPLAPPPGAVTTPVR